jgi:hypothetical protein
MRIRVEAGQQQQKVVGVELRDRPERGGSKRRPGIRDLIEQELARRRRA